MGITDLSMCAGESFIMGDRNAWGMVKTCLGRGLILWRGAAFSTSTKALIVEGKINSGKYSEVF